MLEKEFHYYENHRNEFVKQYLDKFIVISDDKLVAAYDNENDAYYTTIKSIPLGSFLIQHVTEPEEIVQISPFAGGYLL
jgi:hypothetical protein